MSSGSRALRILAPAALLAAAPPAGAGNFDGFAYRVEHGAAAVAAETAALERADPKHGPGEETAARLARLTIAGEARSRTEYERGLVRVLAERARIARDVRTILAGGPYRTEWLNSRWLNGVPAARDQDARALLRRVFADQLRAETRLEGAQARALSYLLRVDDARLMRDNSAWLRGVLARIGWFDISRYGAEASQGAWLIVQHADHDPAWQRAMLPILAERAARGDMQRNYYAYLVDRVAVNAGEPQTYGTQGKCAGGGKWQPFALVDPERLDERRAAVGLEPGAAYGARFNCR